MKAGVVREIYLRSVPSVDINTLGEGEQVAPWEHKLRESDFERIKDEYCETKDDRMQIGWWMLNSGPSIILNE